LLRVKDTSGPTSALAYLRNPEQRELILSGLRIAAGEAE